MYVQSGKTVYKAEKEGNRFPFQLQLYTYLVISPSM